LPASGTLDYATLYEAALGVLVLTVVCLGVLVRSSFGLRLMAVRDDEDAAAELGVNSFGVKMTAYVVSAFFIGLAGALIALQSVSIEPNSAFSLNWTVNMIIMAVLGGMRSFWGPLLGATIFVVLQDYVSSRTENWMSFIGLFFVLIVLFFPRVILDAVRRRACPP